MGKGWKKAGMMENAQKKGAQFTKMAREIYVATKLGGPDPEANSRLKMAINAALKVSCPKATIDRAIKKGSGGLSDDSAAIEEVLYEGQGPHNVGVMVLCQTDNRNRTVSEIRNIFKKNGGLMGDQGSAAWMFDKVSFIEGHKEQVDDPEEDAIEVGANEVEFDKEENAYYFFADFEELDNVRQGLQDRGWHIESAELYYKAKNKTELDDDQKKELDELVNALDDNEDSFRIYTSAD